MDAVFYFSAFLMLLVAMSFATAPLLRRAQAASGGFANVPLLAVIAALLLAVGLYAAIGRPDIASNGSIANSSPAAYLSRASSVSSVRPSASALSYAAAASPDLPR